MIIKCPQCATGYNIPENVLGDKPRKMRCTKCQNMFTVARRSENPPSGYVEFTGKQHLPSEFAFLHESKTPAVSTQSETPPAPEQTPPPQPDRTPDRATQSANTTATTEHSAPQRSGPNMAPQPTTRETTTPVSTPAEDLFGSTTSAWEMEAPLELGGFAIGEETHHGGQTVGKVVFAITLLISLFLAFVAYRNGWSLSPFDLPEQIAFACSGEEFESLPDEVENIDVSISTKTVVIGRNQSTFLSISGEIINNNASPRENVIVRGRLIDGAGDMRLETRVPCGKTIDENAIKKTAPGALQGHYMSGGKLYNCHLAPNGSTIFQVVFENLPADYNAGFDVKIVAVAANTI